MFLSPAHTHTHTHTSVILSLRCPFFLSSARVGDLRAEPERESLPDKHGRDVPVCVSEKVKKEEEDEGKK